MSFTDKTQDQFQAILDIPTPEQTRRGCSFEGSIDVFELQETIAVLIARVTKLELDIKNIVK